MDYKVLSNEFGTPLYIYDVDQMNYRIKEYQKYFYSASFQTEIAYASKAFCIKEILRLIKQHDLSLDVVSLGELYTAEAVHFDFSKIYFHGNNKSAEELIYALERRVGYIVVDNLCEIQKIDKLCQRLKLSTNLLIRLNVGVEAHTHQYIVTSHVDSKFGVGYYSDEFKDILNVIQQNPLLHLKGFHCHIGSQIFDLSAFYSEIDRLTDYCKDFNEPMVLDIGGGFGVQYVDSDQPLPISVITSNIISYVEEQISQKGISLAKLVIEPGRSIVAEAGSTLYSIGGMKKTPNRLYYFVDGGMTDNIRPALYQAKYNADIVGKEDEFKKTIVTIAGKCCESGDILIENIPLQIASVGDLLVTYCTGAYGYAMCSNYNKSCTPAVVFVEKKHARLVVRRQSLEELIEREI